MNLNPIPVLKRLLAKVKQQLHRLGNADTSATGPSAPASEQGIGIAAIDERFIDGRFEHRFGTRDYKLYLPPSGAGQRPARPVEDGRQPDLGQLVGVPQHLRLQHR